MRYAVLSDVHANLTALTAVLEALDDVDAYLCTGDLVGYGPSPNECVELLAAIGAVCVAGNHDLIAVGALDETQSGLLARQTLAWTRRVMTPAARAYLQALPRTTTVAELLLAHGSPEDPEEYVLRPERAVEILAKVEDPQVTTVLLGHTHHQWVVGAAEGVLLHRRTGRVDLVQGQRYLLNAGSVGQSRDGDALARFLVLDTTERTAEMKAVEYDVRASSAALRAAGLPVRALHATDHSPRELALGARRRLRRATERWTGRPLRPRV